MSDSSMNIVKLPCGYVAIDEDTQEKVLLNEIELREITGYEEDILGNKEISIAKKLSLILSRCMVRISSEDGGFNITEKVRFEKIVNELPVGDRLFILIKLRKLSVGNDLKFNVKCGTCKKEFSVNFNLDELEIKKPVDPLTREYDVTVPSGKIIKLRILTGTYEREIGQVNKKYPDAVFSAALAVRVVSIDGKELEGKLKLDTLKSLPLRDRNFLRDLFNEKEGGVETTIDVVCPDTCDRDDCPGVIKTDLDIGSPDFFFPSQQRENI